MTRVEALAKAQAILDRLVPGARAWGEPDEYGVLLGTWEPYEGDEESEVCMVQSVRWCAKTWEQGLKEMESWLVADLKFKAGGPGRRKS